MNPTPPPAPTPRTHAVRTEDEGERLDRVLARAWPDLTRSRIQALIAGGHVTVDGRAAKSSEPAKSGTNVIAAIPAPTTGGLVPEDVPFPIVYEDDAILVVDKPAGLVVHPGAGVRTGTLVHALLAHAPGIAGVGGETRPGLVHRLDRDTSGLLVVAKTGAAHRALTEAIAAREVRRTYLALVWGAPRFEKERVEAALGRDRKDRTRMAVVPSGRAGARDAATRVKVIARLPVSAMRPRFALVECTLETGRTHQIRVHLAHRGHPVVGDATYGGGGKKALSLPPADRRLASRLVADLGRQALHACRLAFRHPVNGTSVAFESPLPDDFTRALTALGFSVPPVCP